MKNENYIEVPVGKVISESNRKHGGTGNIDILAESIKQYGLRTPPEVVKTADGNYRVVDGRRRMEAVLLLEWKTVAVQLIEETDEATLTAIALTENVNRAEMNPLDEGELFKSLLTKHPVKEIAARYDRTVSGITHRVRLCGLRDEIKAMFREDKIKLSSASLLASLPEDDQRKFAKKYQNREAVGIWEVQMFVNQANKLDLKYISDKECASCKKRTFNTEQGLFDDFSDIKDTCNDAGCYGVKWSAKLSGMIAEQGGATEAKLIIENGVPPFYGKSGFKIGGAEYEVLSAKKFTFNTTNKKSKNGTAWLVSVYTELSIKRVQYKEFTPLTYSQNNEKTDHVKKFLLDRLSEIPDAEKKEIAEKLNKQHECGTYSFFRKIKETLLREIIERRVKEESKENVAALYIGEILSEYDVYSEFKDDFRRQLFKRILGFNTLSDIPEDELLQNVFLFLAACLFDTGDLPDLNDTEEEWARSENSLFWKFARISREEYTALYTAKLREVVEAETGGLPPYETEQE